MRRVFSALLLSIGAAGCASTEPTTNAGFGDARPTAQSLEPSSTAGWSLRGVNGTPLGARTVHGSRNLIVFSRGFSCAHCVTQLEALQKVSEQLKSLRVTPHVVVNSDRPSLSRAAGKSSWSFDFYPDPSQKAFRSFLCNGDPVLHGVFLLDERGRIRWSLTSAEALEDFGEVVAQSKAL